MALNQLRIEKPLLYSLLLSACILLFNWSITSFIDDVRLKAIILNIVTPFWDFLAVSALFWAAKRSARQSHPLTKAWFCLGLAQLASAIGDSIWAFYEIPQGVIPFPSVADGFYLLAYPLLIFSVVLMPSMWLTWSEWFKTALDVSIVMLALSLALWRYWIGPLVTSLQQTTLLGATIALAYPIGDLMLLYAVINLLYKQRSSQYLSLYILLILNYTLLILLDSIYGYQSITGRYVSAGWLDIGWIWATLNFSLIGVWQATRRPLVNTRGDREIQEVSLPAKLNTWLTYLPYGVAIMAYLMIAPNDAYPLSWGNAWVPWGVGSIIGLVLLRQMITLRENSLLFAQGRQRAAALRQTNVTLQGQIIVRQQIEDELHARTSRLATLIENLQGGILVKDSTHHIAHINQVFCDMFGIAPSPTDLLGTHIAHLNTAIAANFPNPVGYLQRIDEIIHQRQPVKAEELMGTKGRIFERDYAPIFEDTDEQGHLWHYRDITTRKQAEATIRHSEERYRILFDHNPQPMWVYDLETLAFLEVNAAAVRHYGYSREEFLTMTITVICLTADPVDLDDELSPINTDHQAIASGCHQKKDGTQIDVELITHRLMRDEGYERPAQLVLVYDVTARRILEEQLRQAQKMETIGQLAGGIAHDFNNLLTGITGYSELALRRLQPGDPVHRDLEQIKKAGDRATTLTRQLLAFSRKQILQPQLLDLNIVVAETEKLLRHLIGEHIQIRAVLEPTRVCLQADAGQLEQVIMNLVLNARDAMPHGGQLMIETANVYLNEAYASQHRTVKAGHYVMLAISDTGTGMDKQTQKHIFEPFFTTKEVGKGTGLGLATVYGIVKQSGGNIWVYSEVGVGTVFKVYLPRVDADTPKETQTPRREAICQGTETILLAEDEELVQELARTVLVTCGYQVLAATDGNQAFLVSERYPAPIHLLLTDVIMPALNGGGLAKSLASVRPTMKVLYMSGYMDNAIVHQGVLAEGANFIQKPFTAAQLADKVRAVLDG